MAWEIKLEKEAQKELNKISDQYKEKVLAALPMIAANPFVGKKLKGNMGDFYSYRVWPYRIIYKIYKEVLVILVIHISHRQGAYK